MPSDPFDAFEWWIKTNEHGRAEWVILTLTALTVVGATGGIGFPEPQTPKQCLAYWLSIRGTTEHRYRRRQARRVSISLLPPGLVNDLDKLCLRWWRAFVRAGRAGEVGALGRIGNDRITAPAEWWSPTMRIDVRDDTMIVRNGPRIDDLELMYSPKRGHPQATDEPAHPPKADRNGPAKTQTARGSTHNALQDQYDKRVSPGHAPTLAEDEKWRATFEPPITRTRALKLRADCRAPGWERLHITGPRGSG